MNNFKRILVTGGYGFIGNALIRKLLKDTDSEIFNIDKFGIVSNDQSIKSVLGDNQKYNKRYSYYNIDLFDFSLLKSIFFKIKPDLVFHLAAESHVDRSIEDPKQFLNSNIIGTYNLIEITREYLKSDYPKNFRLLHISTDEVFGSLGESGKFNEVTPYNPRSPYSATKACSDHLVRAWRHTYQLPFIVTNCSNNFGEWQFPEKLIPLTIQKILKKEKIPIYGNGLQIRDWLYVEDHVNALLMISKKGKSREDYCVGGNSERSNLDVIKKISQIINKFSEHKHNIKELISFVKDRPGHDTRYAIDFKKINLELGWEPKYKFDKALEITTKWYINNQNWSKEVLSRADYKTQRLGLIK